MLCPTVRLSGAGLLLALGLVGCSSESDSGDSAKQLANSPAVADPYLGPAVRDFQIWRPYVAVNDYQIDPDRIHATAFAVHLVPGDDPVMIMPLHPALQQPDPVVNRDAAEAARSGVTKIMVSEAFGAADAMRQLRQIIEFEDADESDGDRWTRDLVAVSAGALARGLRPLQFATATPHVGDTVWMATAVYAGASPSRVAHQATVTQVDGDGRIEYRFANSRLSLQATAGAPLLDDAGHVVGVHLGEPVEDGGAGDEPQSGVFGFGVSAAEVLRAWGGGPATGGQGETGAE
ncbi:serine protease [Stieleria sp. ICT_E10.1]|uniref:serine protease n=1 Tax=Stieleria sedimenti TaxID=2976331 RepID=UPI00218042EA|nr:serine protease [Stieleria sedimenti]MCS7466607.1 serine protease [Stieleria sedimenti]